MLKLLFAIALGFAFPAQAQVSAYVSGGVGEEERQVLLPRKNEFNLQLTFAVRRSGNYLAAVEVRIADSKGAELLRAESDGPFFFARLEPGSYTVSATYAGETQSRRLRIPDKGAVALALYWDEAAR